jgi:hypothetical protein
MLVVASKDAGLEVRAGNPNYALLCRNQTAGLYAGI